MSLHRSFDDVWIGESTRGRDAVRRNVPDAREFFAIAFAVEFAIARQRRGETRLACAHSVALAGDGKRCGSGASDISSDECEVIDRGDRSGTLSGVVHAHGPADEGGLRATVQESS